MLGGINLGHMTNEELDRAIARNVGYVIEPTAKGDKWRVYRQQHLYPYEDGKRRPAYDTERVAWIRGTPSWSRDMNASIDTIREKRWTSRWSYEDKAPDQVVAVVNGSEVRGCMTDARAIALALLIALET